MILTVSETNLFVGLCKTALVCNWLTAGGKKNVVSQQIQS